MNKRPYRFQELNGKMHVIFEDGRVRQATSVEIDLCEYIREIYDKRLESGICKIKEKKK